MALAVVLLSGVACGAEREATAPQESETHNPSGLVIESLPLDLENWPEFGYEPPPIHTFQPLGQEGCKPPSPLVVQESLATSDEIRVWALFVTKAPPWELVAGDEAKIVWRSDGQGEFEVFAVSPGGARVASQIGMDPHVGSNWPRAGSEWGSIFRFSEPGCWEFRIRHGDARAALWLVIDG